MKAPMRYLYLSGGVFFVGLGTLGMFLPVLPTVVFFLVAAILFARSNPEWERRIMEHPELGPPIRAFRERGAIGPGAKKAAIGAMIVSSGLSAIFLNGWVAWLPATICSVCAVYILTRPSH